MHLLGLDIGTTTISAVVLARQTGALLESATIANDAWVDAARTIQDPVRIAQHAVTLAEELCQKYAPVACIGLTGQMHGILYLDASGEACSPLYTWQDTHGKQPHPESGDSFAETLSQVTGCRPLATGYGAVTHFVMQETGRLPSQARGLCTIADYVGMRLCTQKQARMHVSNAASLGLYDLTAAQFDRQALARAGMDASFFPTVENGYALLGKTGSGIPVAVAIGDNQASFIGSVRDMAHSLLINVGTGGQISLLSDTVSGDALLEARPCTDNRFLLVGSTLCAGRAYALLERFYADVAEMATGKRPDALYAAMETAARPLFGQEHALRADTRFDGTRQDSSIRGSLHGIGTDTFTPGALTLAVLEGMAQEFYDLYTRMALPPEKKPSVLVASGNGVRKNPLLQDVLRHVFDLPLYIPVHSEEAAFGAALFASVCAGFWPDLAQAQACIRYI